MIGEIGEEEANETGEDQDKKSDNRAEYGNRVESEFRIECLGREGRLEGFEVRTERWHREDERSRVRAAVCCNADRQTEQRKMR